MQSYSALQVSKIAVRFYLAELYEFWEVETQHLNHTRLVDKLINVSLFLGKVDTHGNMQISGIDGWE